MEGERIKKLDEFSKGYHKAGRDTIEHVVKEMQSLGFF